MIINNLSGLLQGKSAIAVFTKTGQYLDLDKGKTGIWKIDISRITNVSKIVIYYRHNNVNEIYWGDYKKFSKSGVSGRFYIHSDNFKYVGFTHNNWNGFALAGQNPIRYHLL